MPSWLMDTFIVVNTGLLVINTILLLLVWEVRRRESERGGERDWSWYDKRDVWAHSPQKEATTPQRKENKNGNI